MRLSLTRDMCFMKDDGHDPDENEKVAGLAGLAWELCVCFYLARRLISPQRTE